MELLILSIDVLDRRYECTQSILNEKLILYFPCVQL